MNNEKSNKFKSLFKQCGAAFKDVDAYGSQVVVTCHSEAAADKITTLMTAATFKHRGTVKAIDYAKKNKGTCLNPSVLPVWRAFFCG